MASRLGLAVIGLGGAVASTVGVGLSLLRMCPAATIGLPLRGREIPEAVGYDRIELAGWDLLPDDLTVAARRHNVVDRSILEEVSAYLSKLRPWPAVGNRDFSRQVAGQTNLIDGSFRTAIAKIRSDLAAFRKDYNLHDVVVVNLSSTERAPNSSFRCFKSLAAFENAIDDDSSEISPAMIYAYAAIGGGYPYANFTPSVAADVGPLEELAVRMRVPIAGKDGKTGQTLVKTALAPVFRSRGIQVASWYSTNLLGNSDGYVLSDEGCRASKIMSKSSVLSNILGYEVDDHRVDIIYVKSKGDDKEAWDSIDLVGFLGKRMQMKINFLCADSILAAPLVIELARMLDVARKRRLSGVQSQLNVFFKSPHAVSLGNSGFDHAKQQSEFDSWLSS